VGGMPRELPGIFDILRVDVLMDADGRPLAEHQAAPSAQHGVDAGRVTCEYENSPSRYRHSKPMRRAGYDQVKDHFDEFLWLVDGLRGLQLAAVGRPKPLADDLRRICFLGEDLPRYLRLDAYLAQADGALSSFNEYRVAAPASVAFKSMRGILKLVDHMQANVREVLASLPDERRERLGLAHGELPADATLDLAWTGDDLLFLAEQTGVLVGDHEVCAGTPSMIRRTLDTMVAGREGETEDAWIGELIGDQERFMRFSKVLYDTSPQMRSYMVKCRNRLQVIQQGARSLNAQSKRSRVYKAHADGLEAFLVSERRVLESLEHRQAELLALFDVNDAGPRLVPQQMNELARKNPRDLVEATYGAHASYEERAIRVEFRRDFKHRDLVVPYSAAAHA